MGRSGIAGRVAAVVGAVLLMTLVVSRPDRARARASPARARRRTRRRAAPSAEPSARRPRRRGPGSRPGTSCRRASPWPSAGCSGPSRPSSPCCGSRRRTRSAAPPRDHERWQLRRRPPPPPRGGRVRRRSSGPARRRGDRADDAEQQRRLLRRGRSRATRSSPAGTASRSRPSAAGVVRRPWETSAEFTLRVLDLVAGGPGRRSTRLAGALPRGQVLRPPDRRAAPARRSRHWTPSTPAPRARGGAPMSAGLAPAVARAGRRAGRVYAVLESRPPAAPTSSRDAGCAVARWWWPSCGRAGRGWRVDSHRAGRQPGPLGRRRTAASSTRPGPPRPLASRLRPRWPSAC